VAPSPRYIDDEGYVGGFTETDIEDLLASLDRNYLGWSSTMAPVIMGNAEGHRLTMATGGHPLPLCRRADGSIETLGRPGSFLGMEETVSVSESAAVLGQGDMVVLYTDGVTEAHEGDAFFGEAGIAEVLAASAGLTAQAVADAVVAAALAFQHGPARDDIAVVVVRKPPPGHC
jgi:serine phosphatase RsbU (regulator of sigma subunit)